MSTNNYMPLYGGDYLRDTGALTLTEHGAYLRLLIHQWHTRNPLPADRGILYRLVSAVTPEEQAAVDSVIVQFFEMGEAGYTNPRMMREIAKCEEAAEAARRAGKASAEARARSYGSADPRANRERTVNGDVNGRSPERSQNRERSREPSNTNTNSIPNTSSKANTNPVAGSESSGFTPPLILTGESPLKTGQLAWNAYAEEFRKRYGVEPVRNARVNSQLAQIVKRIGDDTPDVMRFYVWHNQAFYVRQTHSIGAALADAEALRTQWARGAATTATAARQADRKGAAGAVFANLSRKFEREVQQ